MYVPRKVAAGMAGKVWLPSFEVVRDKGHLAASYIEAMSSCTAAVALRPWVLTFPYA